MAHHGWNFCREGTLPHEVSSQNQRLEDIMATRNAKSATAEEIAAIEDLMSDLEKRLRRLSGNAKREASGATGDVGDFVNEALARIMARVRDSASDSTES